MWGVGRHILKQEMLQWPHAMRVSFLGWKRYNGTTVDAWFCCSHHPTTTLIARFALIRHRRSNVLFYVRERRVPHARAARRALAALPGVLRRQILQYLSVPHIVSLKAWLRQMHPDVVETREARWSPAHSLRTSWYEIQRHLRLAAVMREGTPHGKKKPRLR